MSSLRTRFVGPDRFQRRLDLLSAAVLFLATFLAYAVGPFAVEGGVVFLAMDAALVGTVAAVLAGYRGSGLVFGWLVAYAPLLGYLADDAAFGVSSRSVPERVAVFLTPDGLAFLAVEAVVIGTAAWTVGYGIARVVATLRAEKVT